MSLHMNFYSLSADSFPYILNSISLFLKPVLLWVGVSEIVLLISSFVNQELYYKNLDQSGQVAILDISFQKKEESKLEVIFLSQPTIFFFFPIFLKHKYFLLFLFF